MRSCPSDDTLDQVSAPVGERLGINLPTKGFFSTSNHPSSDSDAENEEGVSSSYRLIDVNLLSATFSDIHKCPEGLLLF